MDIQLLHPKEADGYITESYLGKFSERLVLFYIHKNTITKEITYEMLKSDLVTFHEKDWEMLDTFIRQYISKHEQEGYVFLSAPVLVLKSCLGDMARNA